MGRGSGIRWYHLHNARPIGKRTGSDRSPNISMYSQIGLRQSGQHRIGKRRRSLRSIGRQGMQVVADRAHLCQGLLACRASAQVAIEGHVFRWGERIGGVIGQERLHLLVREIMLPGIAHGATSASRAK